MKKNHTLTLLVVILSFSLTGCGQQKNLIILHTNDTHSRIEPMPANDRYNANTGGVERRAVYINEVKKDNKNVLVFDSGDFLQGTPYFNLFRGEVETKVMSLMGYDAATLGNHEFDYGMDVVEKVAKQATFPIISSNYDFTDTPLNGLIKPYVIFKKGGLKIGVIGIDVKPQGLIASANYAGMKYLPPLETANELAAKLKKTDKCDIVICLSHLGYDGDVALAPQSKDIDIILGGHSHTFMKEPETFKNSEGKNVTVFQNGDRGLNVGRLDLVLERMKR